MPEESLHTLSLHRLLDQIQAGEASAQDELVRRVIGRMERLTRKMLRGFQGVRAWEQTGDVLQNALMRLLRTLQKLRPADTRGFFSLAAEHIRRELIDLNRHYQGALGHGKNLELRNYSVREDSGPPSLDPLDSAPAIDELEKWHAFHQAVANLQDDEREVFNLTFYHGWTQVQIAQLLGVHERTVRRLWQSACLQLAKVLGENLPLS